MKNLDVKNIEAFKQGKRLRLGRRSVAGIIISCLVMGLFYSQFYENDNHISSDDTIIATVEKNGMEVTLEDVNNLNIIINNSNCSDIFINGIVDELTTDGINFTLTNDEKNIDVENAVIITLDQQYISGPGTIVLAPFDNERKGESDALALSLNAGLYESGFLIEPVQCGKMGYMQLEDGTVVERIPTETEDAISPETNNSFVTVCFGTQNTNPQLVAQAIERSIARFAYYNKNEKVQSDLITRVTEGDEEILNTTEISPVTMVIRAFDEGTPIVLGDVEKTIWYK